MNERDNTILVFITVPNKEVGNTISNVLVKNRIAACVNSFSPLNSVFNWKGELCEEEEVLLIVKSRASLFEELLIPTVLENHPYEVPEIIALPIVKGFQGYLDWILEETRNTQ